MGVIVLLALSGCDLGIGHIVVVDDGWDAADTGVADTDAFYVEDTGVPTDRPDTGTPDRPDTDRPDTDRPDTGRPDTDRPDTDRPDIPDTGSTDTESPDTGSRDTGSWDTGSPDEEDAPRWCSMDTIRTAPCVDGVAAWNTNTYTRYRLVQSAIDDAVSGDTVAVCAGTWTENLTIPAIELTLRGYGDDTTVLDGGGSGTVVSIESGADLELADLAIVNGSESGVFGSSADLLTCGVRFEGNSSDNGGGLALWDGTWTGEDVSFIGNYSEYAGGGASLGPVTTQLTHAVFTGNSADYEGGGMSLTVEGTTYVWDSRFESNFAGYEGGGISSGGWTSGGGLWLSGVTLTGNFAGYEGGGIDAGSWGTEFLVLQSCTLTDNVSDYAGGAVSLGTWGSIWMIATDSTFASNSSRSGGAFDVGSWGYHSLTLVDSTVDSNNAEAGGAFTLAGWGVSELFMVGGAVTNNVSVSPVLQIDPEATVSVISSDWGTGSTDNYPGDVGGYVAGSSATFSCLLGYCY